MATNDMSSLLDTLDTADIEKISAIQELICELRQLDWKQKDIAKLVRGLIEPICGRVKVDWEKFCTSGPEGYKRILLCQDEAFTLLLLCFQPRKGNLIHDHGDAKCCFQVLHGKILEKQYKKPCHSQPCPMKWKAKRIYEAGEINDSSTSLHLHCCRSVCNDTAAVTLVLYYPPITQCNVYDELTGKASLADLTFDAPGYAVQPKAKNTKGIGGVVTDDHDSH